MSPTIVHRFISALRQIVYPTLIAVLFVAASITTFAQQPAPTQAKPPDSISTADFSRMIREMSEEGGYFLSDNFTSNETSYLHVVDKLRQLGASGGAYIGVGPEQNFTYIAKIRPRIAFIVDIRRQAMIQHMIIPLVGDFGGTKTLAAVGDYLRKNGLTVTAYYLSNVEQYLFDGSSFDGFARNVKKLPITDKSLFIRAVFNMRYTHPAGLPGHLSTTLLQRMADFVKDYDDAAYHSYRDVIFSHYIAAEKP